MTDEASQSFASVWDAIEETPEAAANMRRRSDLMVAIQSAVEGWHMTHTR
jgi:predicted XRE-type DNA-binding protein